jgi:hypothetical protein
MIASHPWLGITKPEWLIKSATPQYGPGRWPTSHPVTRIFTSTSGTKTGHRCCS